MTDPQQLYEFPHPSNTTLLVVAFALLGLLAVAVFLEVRRRRALRLQRIDREWRNVENIAEERGLDQDQVGRLRAMIEEFASDEPLRVVTLRKEFDQCVAKAMNALWKREDREHFESEGRALRHIRERLGLDHVPLAQQITSTRNLAHDQAVLIGVPADGRREWHPAHVGTVDEAFFDVSPESSGKHPALQPGDTVRFRLNRPSDARYSFATELAKAEDSPLCWVFHHTDNVERYQSREYYRVTFEQKTSVEVLEASATAQANARAPVTKLSAQFRDLSGSGCALILNQDLPKQVLLRVEVRLPETGSITLTGRIVRTEAVSSGNYIIRAMFVDMDDETRDAILRYVMSRQQAHEAAHASRT